MLLRMNSKFRIQRSVASVSSESLKSTSLQTDAADSHVCESWLCVEGFGSDFYSDDGFDFLLVSKNDGKVNLILVTGTWENSKAKQNIEPANLLA